jgi:hypothetical protein
MPVSQDHKEQASGGPSRYSISVALNIPQAVLGLAVAALDRDGLLDGAAAPRQALAKLGLATDTGKDGWRLTPDGLAVALRAVDLGWLGADQAAEAVYAALEPGVAAAARTAAAEIKERMRRSAAMFIEIGERLAAVKASLPHGAWLPWLKAEFRMSDTTARNFIRVASVFGGAGKPAIISDLPPTALIRLASASAEARAAVVERAQAGERMTVAAVERAIKDAAEAKPEAAPPTAPAPVPAVEEQAPPPAVEVLPPEPEAAAPDWWDAPLDLHGPMFAALVDLANEIEPPPPADPVDALALDFEAAMIGEWRANLRDAMREMLDYAAMALEAANPETEAATLARMWGRERTNWTGLGAWLFHINHMRGQVALINPHEPLFVPGRARDILAAFHEIQEVRIALTTPRPDGDDRKALREWEKSTKAARARLHAAAQVLRDAGLGAAADN